MATRFQNLYSFLSLWSEKQDSRWIWIDQICINQTDLQERSAQVQQMEQIFSTASTVMAWIGKSDWHDLILAELREQLLKGRREAWIWSNFARIKRIRVDGASAILQQSEKYREIDPKIENAVTDLFARSYWKRLWVAQEIGLARQLVMHYGSITISPLYLTFLGYHVTPHCAAYHGRRLITELGVVSMVDQAVFTIKKPDLWQPLQQFGHLDCENPRDKVYGLLALAESRQRRDITVDYDLSVEMVWQNAVDVMTKWDRLIREKDISSDVDEFPRFRPPKNSQDIILLSDFADICEDLGTQMQVPEPFIRARLEQQLQVLKVGGFAPRLHYYYISKRGWALLPEHIEHLWESLRMYNTLPPWDSESVGGNRS